MIKAVIFDCFGVLVESSYRRFFDGYLSDKPEIVRKINLLSEQSARANITIDDFYHQVSELTGISESEIRNHLSYHPPNIELLNHIRDELKPSYKIGLLSNVSSDRLDELFTDDQVKLFDGIVLSYAVKMIKPEREIYLLAASRLGVLPSECVFIDDVERYATGAKSAGMQAIVYRDFMDYHHQAETLLKR